MAANETSLSSITASGRQFVIWGVIFLLVLIFGRVLLRFSVDTYSRLNPPPTPGPTMGFGRIAQPAFPSQLQEDRPEALEIGTIGNRLPSMPSQMPVYFIPLSTPNLIALDRAREKASNLSFILPPEKVSNDIYRWRQSQPLAASLEMNIITGTADMNVDWASSVTLLNERNLPSRDTVRSRTRELMRQVGVVQSDVATAEPEITYVRALAGEIRPVASVSEADFVVANVSRVGPLGIPTVTARRDRGVISAMFSGSRLSGESVLQFRSDYYPVDWTTFHTYPMITAAQAWQLLEAGSGYISSPLPEGKNTAIIRDVYLAYYEPSTPQNYYQPVYVFDGDDNFRAIVPGLHPQVFTTE